MGVLLSSCNKCVTQDGGGRSTRSRRLAYWRATPSCPHPPRKLESRHLPVVFPPHGPRCSPHLGPAPPAPPHLATKALKPTSHYRTLSVQLAGLQLKTTVFQLHSLCASSSGS
ncbi:hypothetical protein M758_8G144100 [Ceratodon purpureus]|nr:hypothetical protein M758_8G144100 [Ceratodon purpureus]